MTPARVTDRERATLEHLKQAKELGSTLRDYAAAFNLNVKDLYNGRAQLQRKGLWPKIRNPIQREPKLLAVRVTETDAATPAPGSEWMFRLTGPGGWVMECRQLPEVSWLKALLAAPGKAAA